MGQIGRSKNRDAYHLVVRGLGNGVRGVGILGVGTSPDVDLIGGNGRVRTGLVSLDVVVGHREPSCKKIRPCPKKVIHSVIGLPE